MTHHAGKNSSGLEGYSPFAANSKENAESTPVAGPAIMHPTTQDISPNPTQYNKNNKSAPQYTVEELEVKKFFFVIFKKINFSLKIIN